MTHVAVLVPALGRPTKVEPLASQLAASEQEAELHLVMLCSPGDHDQHEAVRAIRSAQLVIVDWEPGRGDYARKINFAFRELAADGVDWMLTGSDDLSFGAGWADEAIAVHGRTGACVIGTNDLGNPDVKRGRHATHSLVHRDYLECGTIDEDDKILHEGYDHNFVDNELVGTARARGTFAFAKAAVVEHMHPNWRKGEWDATYTKGQRDFDGDRRLFHRRRPMWERA